MATNTSAAAALKSTQSQDDQAVVPAASLASPAPGEQKAKGHKPLTVIDILGRPGLHPKGEGAESLDDGGGKEDS